MTDQTAADQTVGFTYRQLSETNERYDGALIEELDDLFEGGYAIQKKAKKYLPRMAFEGKRYEERCKGTAYRGFLSQILGQFIADLASQPLSILPSAKEDEDQPEAPEYPDKDFYGSFFKDADLCGNDFTSVLLECAERAMLQGRAFMAIDAPVVEDGIEGARALEQEDKNRVYAYCVPTLSVIDWSADRYGELEWVMLKESKRARLSIGEVRGLITESFTYWSLEGSGQATRAVWRRYSITRKPEETIADDRIVSLEAQGATDFHRIPFVLLEKKQMWVGNLIGPQAMQYWRDDSALTSAMNRSMVAIPCAALGTEIGAMGGVIPSEVQQNPNRGKDPVKEFADLGYNVHGAGDRIYFAEPEGKAYEIRGKANEGLRESMFSVTHQIAASIKQSGQALGRSGLSKAKDDEKTEKVLTAFGGYIRTFAIKIMRIISEARGEAVEWVAHGMNDFRKIDREQLIEEGTAMPLLSIKSPTFLKRYRVKMAKELLDTNDPVLLAKIEQEEGDEVDKEIKEQENQKKLLEQNPMGAMGGMMPAKPPTAGPPKPGAPKQGPPSPTIPKPAKKPSSSAA